MASISRGKMQMLLICTFFWITTATRHNVLSMDLEELKRYAYPAQFGRADMLYVTMKASQLGPYLETMTCRNEHLYLTVDTRLTEETISYIDLTYLFRCNLSQVWIESAGYNSYVSINYKRTDSGSQLVGVTELHLIGPFLDSNISSLITDMPHLEFLELKNNIKIKDSKNIINALRGKPVKVLKLNGIKVMTTENLQPRVFFAALNNSPLVCLEFCNNDASFDHAGLFDVAPHLRIINVSHNGLLQQPFTLDIFLNPVIEVADFSHMGPIYNPIESRSVNILNGITGNIGNTQAISTNDEEAISMDHLIELCNNSTYFDLANFSRCFRFKCFVFKFYPHKHIWELSCSVLPDIAEIKLNFSCTPPFKLPYFKNAKSIIANFIQNYPLSIHPVETKHICVGKNTLQKLSLNHLEIALRFERLTSTVNDIMVSGLEDLSELDLSFNRLRIHLLNSSLLKSFPNLHILYIQGNNISIDLENGRALCDLYPQLRHIDLSSNNLSTVGLDLVKSCKGSLYTINLSNNKIQELHSGGQRMPTFFVKTMNFSHNKIRTFTETTQRTLSQIQPLNGNKVGLDLSNNPFICDCSKDSLKMIEILQSSAEGKVMFLNRNNYACLGTFDTSGPQKFIMDINLRKTKAACFPNKLIKPLIISTTCSTVVIVCSVLVILYKYRYHIFTMYYRMRHRCSRKHAERGVFDYDAFVSYCSEDRIWVHDVLMQTLESKYKLDLCIHLRDFLVGEAIDDEIVRHMEASRNHIIIFSDNYLKKTWPVFELQRAYREHVEQKKGLVVIKFGKISTDELSGLAKELWDSRVYLEWPENRNGKIPKKTFEKIKSLFWERLVFKIYGHEYPCYMKDFLCCCRKKVLSIDDDRTPLL